MKKLLLVLLLILLFNNMAVSLPYKPFPVPTPGQPVEKGGNPYVKPNTNWQMIGASAVPTGSSGGYTNMGGVLYPSTSINTSYGTAGTAPVQKQQPTYNPPSNQNNYPSDFGGGGTGADMTVDGRLFSSEEDYSKWLSAGGAEGERQRMEAELTDQLNATYDPAYKNLDEVEAQYRQEYPTSQAFIEQSFGEVKPQIENEKTTKLAGLKTQKGKAQIEEKSQIEKARQMYNELKTSGLTRFGGSSSTGGAYGELLGRTTAQQMGETEKNFGDMYNQITTEETNVNTFYTEKLTNLEKEKQLKLRELKDSFDAQIRSINTQRASLDSEKAARRLAALQEYAAQARQMQYDQYMFQQKLDTWKAAKDEAIATAKQFNAKSFTLPGMPGVLNSTSFSGINQGGGSDMSPEQIAAAKAAGYVLIGDEWKRNYSPFAGLDEGGTTETGNEEIDINSTIDEILNNRKLG